VGSAMLNSPLVDGISPRVFWSDVEPADGTFVWTTLDGLIAYAAAVQKVVTIRVMPGYIEDSLAEGAGFELSVPRGKKAFESGNLVLNRQDTGEHNTISALLIMSRSGRIVDDRNK
jgi:hypothetical protein